MEILQNVLTSHLDAHKKARLLEKVILSITNTSNAQDRTKTQIKDLSAATISLEALAVDTFSKFEFQMQHYFKRGPFARKLKTLLLEANQPDLANRFHQLYLAINVLKHGKGASYRELLQTKTSYFVINRTTGSPIKKQGLSSALIEISIPGFFENMIITITDAYHFLTK